MKTLGQERAEFALKEVLDNKNKNIDKLKPFSAGAPTVILQNGFGQAMAFWLSKQRGDGGEKYKFIFDSIMKWLIEKKFIKSGNKDDKNFILKLSEINQNEYLAAQKGFILKLSEINQNEYLAAQKEALLLLEWIKRYASAFCQDEQDNNDKKVE